MISEQNHFKNIKGLFDKFVTHMKKNSMYKF